MGIFLMALARGSGAETSDHISRAITCASCTRLREYTRAAGCGAHVPLTGHRPAAPATPGVDLRHGH